MTISVVGQESTTTIPLIKALKKIEKSYDVKFSYNRRDLKSIEVTSIPETKNIAEALNHLSAEAGLKFTQIKERYIAVQLQEQQLITVCGILIETESSVPIYEAEITVNNVTIMSDSGGNFRVTEIGENENLSVYVNGFLVRTISARELKSTGQCPFIYISQAYTYLPEVILDNYITKGISKNISGATVIQNENFDILPSLIEPDVLQIAQALPGIDSADETAANLNVRGGTSDEFLILWDDIRMYQSGHFFGLISAFNPNLTKHVTIYKNGTAARYGEGVSGVIAMESSSDTPEQFQGGLGINLTSANAYAEIPATENFLITVSGRTSINTGIGNPVYNEFFSKVFQNTVVTNLQNNTIEGERSTDEQFNFFDVSVKALWKISLKDEVSYHFLGIDNKLQFSERIISQNVGSLVASELEQQNGTHGINYKRSWNRNFSTKFLASTSKYLRSEFSNDVDLNLLQSNRNEVDETSIKIDLRYAPTDEFQVFGGYQYTDTEITDSRVNTTNTALLKTSNTLYANALFASTSFKLFEGKTNITSGLRFTQYPKLSQSFFEPRLHISQKINPALRLHISGELKHQSVYQSVNLRNNLLGVETKDWLLADQTLNPILQSKQVGIGGNFRRKNWTLTSEIYSKEVTGIQTKNLGFRNQLQDANFTGRYNVTGAEISINKRTKQWNVWLSYAHQDNSYTFDNFNPSSFRNNIESRHTTTLAASFDYKDFSFSLGNTLKSGLPYTTPIAEEPIITTLEGTTINFNAPNNARLPSYFRSDFSASYAVDLDETFSGKVNIAFLNIFNRNNALDRYYVLDIDDTGAPTLRRVDQFSLGFTPNISLQLLF
ncbi:TonB-dependent receptor plug domain-containing protein [Rasiella rasia]|uniref:TonB-dependent receptor plug domain-containing protein n=1 Tax=Rasiella rasia TaxID=2744027 RepID=A0A6G6GNB6_9FLAO|nr:TonB-dependent receptor plug domain-containing protein [Rasiella rasia]QIE59191.1 TonB-dependent receptor plug domain-containing protein [Rasiella rasia]